MPPKKTTSAPAASQMKKIASNAFKQGDNSGMLALKAKSPQGKSVTITQTTVVKINK
jgi:hypothetical protein